MLAAERQFPFADVAAVALIAIAIVRVAVAVPVFSCTPDEPIHISGGLQLLEDDRYDIHRQNPPIPRVIMAFWPWVNGVRLDAEVSAFDQTAQLFHSGGDYVRDLSAARRSNLLFFLIAAAALWRWARREMGSVAAAWGLFVFTFEPIVLGLAGIANHDMAAVAGLAVALLAFSAFLASPDLRHATLVGAAYGLAVCFKFTAIAYVPVACAAVFVIRWWTNRNSVPPLPTMLTALSTAAGTTLLSIWALYGFEVGRLDALGGDLPRVTIPAQHFVAGLIELAGVLSSPHDSYLFGTWSGEGWWWYFPVAVALKTTIALMALVAIGIGVRGPVPLRRAWMEGVAAAAAVLLVSMPGRVDVGVRYVLPLYVPLAFAAGAVLASPMRRALRVVALALALWLAGASIFTHPDYLAYFNEIAGREPSRYLLDSNLDWGQDVLRLRTALRKEHADRVGLAVLGPHDFNALEFPEWYHANSWTPASGFTAVSEQAWRLGRSRGEWGWLEPHSYRRIGRSIRLYHLP